MLKNCFGDVKNSAGVVDQARLAACGYPTLGTTGVPSGVVLTPYTGPLTITTAGTVIDGKSIPNCLDIRTTGVVIRNSRITCTSGAFAGVYADNAPAAANLVIQRVEITCVDGHRHGVWVHSATITGAYIHDCENAGEINGNTVVRDSYLMSREVFPGHADDLQSQGGNDVVIDHNTFAGLAPITSSIISNPNSNSRWSVVNNFFSAGAYTLYCPENVGGTWTVRNNRFYGPVTGHGYSFPDDPHSPSFGFTDGCGGVGTWTGNYRDDTLAAVGR